MQQSFRAFLLKNLTSVGTFLGRTCSAWKEQLIARKAWCVLELGTVFGRLFFIYLLSKLIIVLHLSIVTRFSYTCILLIISSPFPYPRISTLIVFFIFFPFYFHSFYFLTLNAEQVWAMIYFHYRVGGTLGAHFYHENVFRAVFKADWATSAVVSSPSRLSGSTYFDIECT